MHTSQRDHGWSADCDAHQVRAFWCGKKTVREGDEAIVRVARAYVRDCCRAETATRVNELAARLQLSRTQVTRAIQRATGRTAAQYLQYLRVLRVHFFSNGNNVVVYYSRQYDCSNTDL